MFLCSFHLKKHHFPKKRTPTIILRPPRPLEECSLIRSGTCPQIMTSRRVCLGSNHLQLFTYSGSCVPLPMQCRDDVLLNRKYAQQDSLRLRSCLTANNSHWIFPDRYACTPNLSQFI